MELEKQSKQWAEGCVFKHEMKEGRGENLAWDSNQKPEKELILGSSGRWFDEKKTYSYGQYSCGASCHYTQMVWGSTSKVGCYSYRCPNLVNAYKNAWYLVCFYTPKGNWNGEKPYDKTCKSKCREGQTEEKGLCVGEGKGGSVNQGGEDGDCNDKAGGCAAWAKNGQCQSNPNYMLKDCKKSCDVCKAKGGSVNQGGEDKGGSVNQGGEDGDCNDNAGGCAAWAKDGQCQINPKYMLKNCKKSCDVCKAKGGSVNQGGEDKGGSVNQGGEDEDCNDNAGGCAAWAKDRQCQINPKYMLKNCKKSCNVCKAKGGSVNQGGEDKGGSVNQGGEDKGGNVNQGGDDKKCNDDPSGCIGRAERGECQTNQDYMRQSCRSFCSFCESDTSCVDSISRCSNWAKANECKTNPDWMWKNCRYSCKKCNRKNRCIDLNSKCDQWAKANKCDLTPSYMSENCQKSCEMC
ncbi:cysteine-rich venom protein LIO1 [Biomphalaria glabrata]|nr:cysteine-rich venom protein LIO1 [Biomphalaria glabrata]